MDSVQVRNSIEEIYDRFVIPGNLRLHMYRVASVAEMICDNRNGIGVDTHDVVAACLLHDLGNIVKFEIKNERSRGLLGADGKDVEYWLGVKRDIVAKYGAVDHVATRNMLMELDVDSRLILMIDDMGGVLGTGGKDFEADICSYSDCRVGPTGVMSVNSRIKDFYERSMLGDNAILKKRAIALRANLGGILKTERKIFADARIRPEQIDDKSIKPYLDRYMKH